MKYSSLFIVFGTIGWSLGRPQNTNVNSNLDDLYGRRNYLNQYQYQDPYQNWNQPYHINSPSTGQPSDYLLREQLLREQLLREQRLREQLLREQQLREQLRNPNYPYPGIDQVYSNQPLNPYNPDINWNYLQSLNPLQPSNPGPFNPLQPVNSIRPVGTGQPLNPDQPLNGNQLLVFSQPTKPGEAWNPSQTFNLGNQLTDFTESSLDMTSMPNTQSQSSSSTTTENVNNGETLAAADCLRTCPVTTEYNPVCGSDNVTYDNPGRLECAKLCGKDIQMIMTTRCPKLPVPDAE